MEEIGQQFECKTSKLIKRKKNQSGWYGLAVIAVLVSVYLLNQP